ncbi:MAG TPA: hypothetical protein VMX11_07150 [Actinomycetes bacterium]|nr:hypothetical protein [Actinomycetes bacterium]
MRRIGQGNLGDLALLSPNDMVELHGTMNLNYAVGLSGLTFTSDPTDPAILDGGGVTPHAFRFNGGDGLGLIGLTIQNYRPGQQKGAVQGADSRRWLIEDCDVSRQVPGTGAWPSLEHGGYGVRLGHEMVLRRSHFNDNPSMGFSGIGDDILIEDVEIARNNWAERLTDAEIEAAFVAKQEPAMNVDAGNEGGGAKLVRTNRLIARHVHCHHNGGRGWWPDHDNLNFYTEDLTSEWNANEGYSPELGGSGRLAYATLRFNGMGRDILLSGTWGWAAQAVFHNAPDQVLERALMVVHAVGGNGFYQISQSSRYSGQKYIGKNSVVRDSVIVYEGSTGQHGSFEDGPAQGQAEPPLWERVTADPAHLDTHHPLLPGGAGPDINEVGARSLPDFTIPGVPPIVIPPEPTDEWEAHVAAADDRLAELHAAANGAVSHISLMQVAGDALHALAITPVAPPPFDAVNATDAELVAEGNRLDALADAVRAEKDARIAT